MKTLLLLLLLLTASTAMSQQFFVMQPLHGNRNELQDAVIAKVDGFHVREKWALVEPSRGLFDFRWLDAQMDRAHRLGKQVTLGIYCGTNSPKWLGVRWTGGIPLPWDVRTVSECNQMIAALGQKYDGESAVSYVHLSGPSTYESMEMHLPRQVEGDHRVVDVWRQTIDAYDRAFPSKPLVLDVAMIPNAGGAFTREVDEYARAVLGSRFVAIHCSLKPGTNPNAPHHREVLRLAGEGVPIGFEMVGPIGAGFPQAVALGRSAGATWFQIYQGDIGYIQR